MNFVCVHVGIGDVEVPDVDVCVDTVDALVANDNCHVHANGDNDGGFGNLDGGVDAVAVLVSFYVDHVHVNDDWVGNLVRFLDILDIDCVFDADCDCDVAVVDDLVDADGVLFLVADYNVHVDVDINDDIGFGGIGDGENSFLVVDDVVSCLSNCWLWLLYYFSAAVPC